jgi:NADPH:quinone reductase-like Zn-dependent oxidoreductase
MRAVVYARQGVPADVLQVAEVDTPGEPGPCEVLVRVLLRPIHYDDLLKVSGRCQPGAAGPAGVGLGLKGYGIVEQAGECVHLRPGVRVAFFPGQGAD